MNDQAGPQQIATPPPQIELRGVRKRFGTVDAVNGVDLVVYRGEFFSLLGPSGCGKSTILKMIAGFEDATSGEILVAGRTMTGVPPERRNIGFVFQNYALFPHMTVAENIAFGLEAHGMGKAEIATRIEEMLLLVELSGLGPRRPSQLSGGQQQRVALARALAIEPDVLLLDEPLGALDRKLRQAMQGKLVDLQRRLGVTTLFVTHDQEEALTMSDRIAVMSVERHAFEQVGAPREIYERPASVRVSTFIGQTNLWEDAIASRESDEIARTVSGLRIAAPKRFAAGDSVVVSLRPERISLLHASAVPPDGANAVDATIIDAIFVGETITYVLQTADGRRLQSTQLNSDVEQVFARGSRVRLAWEPLSMRALPVSTDAPAAA